MVRRSEVPAATFGFAVLIVVVCVAFDPGGFAPFGPLRWMLVSAGTMVVVALAVADRKLVVSKWWSIGWIGFLGWGAVASVLAVDPVHTWIGTPDRRLGLLAWGLFALWFGLGLRIRERTGALPLLKAAMVALLGIGIYVLFEVLGSPPVEVVPEPDRPGGPFGSAAYLGAASTLLLPVAVGAAVDGLGSRRWRGVAVAASAAGVFAVLASQTRAAWVGLVIAALVVVPTFWQWVLRRRVLIASAAAIGAVIVVVSPLGGRVTSAFDFEDGGARGRIDEWRVGTAAVSGHLATGAGFEGYRIVFAEAVDAEYERRYGRTFTPDRAHNGLLDVAITTGIPGAALYAAGMAAVIGVGVRAVRRREPWLVGIGVAVVAYVAQQQFLFPLAEIDVLFWGFVGVAVAATMPGRVVRVPAWAWLVPTAFAAAALVAGGLDVAADRATSDALDLAPADAAAALARVDDAVALRPDSIRYGFVAAAIASRPATPAGYQAALDRIDDTIEVSPQDPILLAARAGYRLDLARAARDPATLDIAVREWEALVDRDPHHADYRLQLGIAYAVSARPLEAEREWLAAAALAPSSSAPWTNLAVLYLDRGDLVAAQDAIDRIGDIDPSAPGLGELLDRLAGLRRENG